MYNTSPFAGKVINSRQVEALSARAHGQKRMDDSPASMMHFPQETLDRGQTNAYLPTADNSERPPHGYMAPPRRSIRTSTTPISHRDQYMYHEVHPSTRKSKRRMDRNRSRSRSKSRSKSRSSAAQHEVAAAAAAAPHIPSLHDTPFRSTPQSFYDRQNNLARALNWYHTDRRTFWQRHICDSSNHGRASLRQMFREQNEKAYPPSSSSNITPSRVNRGGPTRDWIGPSSTVKCDRHPSVASRHNIRELIGASLAAGRQIPWTQEQLDLVSRGYSVHEALAVTNSPILHGSMPQDDHKRIDAPPIYGPLARVPAGHPDIHHDTVRHSVAEGVDHAQARVPPKLYSTRRAQGGDSDHVVKASRVPVSRAWQHTPEAPDTDAYRIPHASPEHFPWMLW